MDLQNILSISGKPGLFKLLKSNSATIIVESLVDKKRTAVHATNRISSLEDISIYTYEEDLPLKEVFIKIHAQLEGKPAIDHKSTPAELRAFMAEMLPDYDEDRVYPSDLKKLFQWYNLLLSLDMLSAEEEVKEEEEIAAPEEAVSEDSKDSGEE